MPISNSAEEVKMVQVSIIVPLSRNAGTVWPELRQILNEYGSEIEVVCVASSRKSFPLGSSFFNQSALSSASPKVSCFNAPFSRENSLQSLPEDMMQDGRLRFVRAPGTEKYAAMNIGLEESRGEYVAFFEPGAKVSPGFYRELYRFASKKRAEIAGCGIKTSNPAGEDILVNIAATGFTSSLKEKARLWRIPQYSYVGNKIYLRRALLENGLFFKEDTKFADMFWTPLVLKKLKRAAAVSGIWYMPPQEPSAGMAREKPSTAEYQLARLYTRAFASVNDLIPAKYAVTRKNICFLGIPIMKVLKSSRCEKCYLFHLKVKENKRRIAA